MGVGCRVAFQLGHLEVQHLHHLGDRQYELPGTGHAQETQQGGQGGQGLLGWKHNGVEIGQLQTCTLNFVLDTLLCFHRLFSF